jgi:hypothetical protein
MIQTVCAVWHGHDLELIIKNGGLSFAVVRHEPFLKGIADKNRITSVQGRARLVDRDARWDA